MEPVGVAVVGIFASDEYGSGDVGVGLVGVERNGAPPLGDGGGTGDWGGDRVDEVLDQKLFGYGPFAVPYDVDVDRRR